MNEDKPAGSTPAATPTPAPTEVPKSETPSGSGTDPVKMAEELGSLRKVKEEYENYKNRTEPIIETIWDEDETRKFVLTKHKKRLGIQDEEIVETPDKPKDGSDPKPAIPPVSPIERDNRNALITQSVNTFEQRVGLDKLDKERRQEMNVKVGAYLTRILDTKGTGKPVTQLLEELPLARLSGVLDDAWYLATKDDREAEMKKQMLESQENQTGIIGGMGGASVSEESVVLTQKEREAARKMNVSEDEYLKNKKNILKNRGEIY